MKRLLSILLTAALLFSIFTVVPISAGAADASGTGGAQVGYDDDYSSGRTGDCTWSLDESGVLTISGNGAMEDYYYSGPWGQEITALTVGDGVTRIGDYAFSYCRQLESVTISNSVTSIGYGAFQGCYALNELSLGNGLTSLDSDAFRNCTSLKSVTIPDSVTKTEGSVFNGCTALETVDLGKGITEIGGYSFYECTSLKNVIFPEGLQRIGDYAFYGCTSLEAAPIGKGLAAIGNYAFSGCTAFTEVSIPGTVTDLGFRIFSDCTGLTKATLGKGLTSTGSAMFYNCTSLTNVVLPDSLTTIHSNTFENCTSLADIAIPAGVTEIYGGAFSGCSSLTEFTVSDNVTSINGAFENCSGLKSIVIGSGVEYLTAFTFRGCSALESITVSPNNANYDSRNNCNAVIRKDNGELVVGTNNTRLPAGITKIADFAFDSRAGIESLTVPEGVTAIGHFAFKNCSGLKELKLPESVTAIGEGAFENCASLKSIYIPATVTEFGTGGDHQDGGAGYRYNPLAGCAGLTKITVAPENKVFDSRDNCNAVIETEKNVLVSGCTATVIPATVTGIGMNAFINQTGLESIIIPYSVKDIGYQAFKGCDSLLAVYYEGTEEDWNKMGDAYSAGLWGVKVFFEYNPDSRYTVAGDIRISAKKMTYVQFDYAVDDPIDEVKELAAEIYVSNYDLMNSAYTVYVNNVRTTGYTVEENTFRVPLGTTLTGHIDVIFSSQPTYTVNVSAKLAVLTDKERRHTIGSASYSDYLTIEAPKATATRIVTVSGTTNPGRTLDIRVDYETAATVTANMAGTYFAEIRLPESDEVRTYKITAVYYVYYSSYDDFYDDSYDVISASTEVTFDPSVFAIEEFVLIYRGIEYDLLQPGKRDITFIIEYYNGNYPFEFRVRFNKSIDKKVYITSTRDGKTKHMRAEYDEAYDGYIAKGYFEKYEVDYVPGLIKVVICDEAFVRDNSISFEGGETLYTREPVIWSIDPRGFVYAGLESCRVYNATVTACYIPYDPETDSDSFWSAPDESRMIVWDAAQYDQKNPLQTTLDGDYAWDVPEGWWKVTVEKDGYESASSDWMPVPPPQLDVNIGIETTLPPEIESAEYGKNGIVITFVHPMKPDSLKDITLKDSSGGDVAFTLEYDGEKAPNGDTLARVFTLNVGTIRSESYTVDIGSCENYSGVKGSVSAAASGEIPSSLLLGDVDGEGEVTILDATYIQRWLASLPIDSFNEDAADADGDGEVSILDATAIQRFLAGLPTSEGIGEFI